MFYYMYQIENLLNNKIYVGVHKTKSLDDGYMGSGKILRSAIVKHGISNFSKVILEYFEDAKSMYAKEAEVVNEEFLLREDVYNIRRGGYGGFDHINKSSLNTLIHEQTFDRKSAAIKGVNACKVRKIGIYSNDFIRVMTDTTRELGIIAAKSFDAIEKRKDTFRRIGHSQGDKNSQSGTIWITDGVKAIKIKKTDLIPDGYQKGRRIMGVSYNGKLHLAFTQTI